MANHTPDRRTVREAFIDGAAGEFIGEDFDRWILLVQADALEQLVAGTRNVSAMFGGRSFSGEELIEAMEGTIADLRAAAEGD